MKSYRKVVVKVTKANPLKESWKRSAEEFVSLHLLLSAGLALLIVAARRHKTSRDRHATWYEAIRDAVITEMTKRDIIEFTASGKTFAQLVPNLSMGKGEKADAKFAALTKAYGHKWVDANVKVVRHIIPSYRVDVITRDPSVSGGKSVPSFYVVDQLIEAEYTFVGKGEPRDQLAWTIVMGNKPTLDVGPVTKRVREGKERNSKRKKR